MTEKPPIPPDPPPKKGPRIELHADYISAEFGITTQIPNGTYVRAKAERVRSLKPGEDSAKAYDACWTEVSNQVKQALDSFGIDMIGEDEDPMGKDV